MSRRLFRASFTAEAALLMPVILLVLFMLLFAAFHLHDRNLIRACALESAVTGKEPVLPFLIYSDAEDPVRTENAAARSVSVRIRTRPLLSGKGATYETTAVYEKLLPIRALRNAKVIKKEASP